MLIKRCIHWLIALVLLSGAVLPASVAFALPPTTVHIAGEVSGYLPAPCNCPVVFRLVADAKGSPTSLEGSGVDHASIGATELLSLTSGSVTDGIVVLYGVMTVTTSPISGTPVVIEANAATGALRYVMGPLTAGVWAGRTFVFDGTATTVVITGE